MINIESAFNDLGIDALTGVELMDWLNISQIDLNDPSRFARLHQVIDYFKQFPKDTQRFLIVRATNGKNVDKLNHVWEYSQLLGRRKSMEDMLTSIEKERSVLGLTPDPLILASVDKRSLETRENIAKINVEAAIYEK